ncbi:MAG: hypothetical protein ACI8PQ_003453 [Planctomycetota bacterium]|jgi:hypothetical protein
MSLSVLIRAQSQPLGILKLLDSALAVVNDYSGNRSGGTFDKSA